MNDTQTIAPDLVERIVSELDRRVKAPVPLDIALWSTKEIGEYLQRPAQSVRERIVVLPGFPAPIRLPSGENGRSFPRWKATEVIAWVESHQNGRGGRGGRPRKED
ncbi:hypothetical protein [Burkholderia gladioli]|uniref:hypothetical protein n=1 Tax=Burkholderia gladioli TaxID=28095 RepID=UPI000CFFE7AD|nr:hypothetical protein [Burkholderia gladioli]PRE90143.1 hypothetical protein C6Q13_05820 [Burkholderia gladioli]